MAGGPPPKAAEDVKKKARIEIIPLIDVIFFLLATFVLFTLSLNKIQSMPLDLPKSTDNPAPPNPDDVTIQVSDGDQLYWNREQISLSDLEGRIKAYQERASEQHILIAGDSHAKLGSTIKVLDAVRKAGIKAVSVETRDRATGR